MTIKRSGGRCEAEVEVGNVWTRCFRSPVETHHMITRARGGVLLDKVGETYHLIDLCHTHHAQSDGQLAYDGGLLLEGYVTSVYGRPVYVGPDEYLSVTYPE